MKIKHFNLIIVLLGSLGLIVSLAIAGSLTPPGPPGSTMRTLDEIYGALGGTFDSSGFLADENGNLIENLKYISNNLFWASSGNDIYNLNSGNVGIGDTSPAALFTVGSGDKLQIDNSGNLSTYGNIIGFPTQGDGSTTVDVTDSGAGTTLVVANTANFNVGNLIFVNSATWTRVTNNAGGAPGNLTIDPAIARASGQTVVEYTTPSVGSLANIQNRFDKGYFLNGVIVGLGTTTYGPGTITTTTGDLTLNPAGNVGIGMTTPSEKLDVAGNIKIQESLLLNQRFEDVTFPPSGWTTGGDVNWYRDTAIKYEGSASAASGTIDDGESTWLDIDYTFPDSGEVSFYWKVSSEEGYDFLMFCLDNDACTIYSGYTYSISGEADWTEVTFSVSAGPHSFRWLYEKDGSVSEGDDKGWVDNVNFYGESHLFVEGDVGIGTTDVTAKLEIENLNQDKASLFISQGSPNAFLKTIGDPSDVDDEEAYSIIQTLDDGYAVVGYTDSFSGNELFFLKFDSSGSLSWAKTVYTGVGYSVRQTSDEGYIIVGDTTIFGAGQADVFLLKFDSSGNLSWAKTIGGASYDSGYSVSQTSDSGYIVAGQTRSFGGTWGDIFLLKFDSLGNLSWAKNIGGINRESGNSVSQTSDGGYIVFGDTNSYGAGGVDSLLLKFDSSGNLSWAKTAGGTGREYSYSVIQTSDDGYLAVSETGSFGAGYYDVCLLKFDSSGSLSWAKTIGGEDYDAPWGYSQISQTSDGGYIVGAASSSFSGGSHTDVFLLKFDSSYNLSWAKTAGGADDEYGFSISQTPDDGYVVVGYTESFGTNSEDILFLKFDSSSNIEGCPYCYTVSPTVTSPSPTVSSPSPTVTSPSPTVTSPSPTVTSRTPVIITQCSANAISLTPLVVDSSGRVGVGTASPSSQLDVSANYITGLTVTQTSRGKIVNLVGDSITTGTGVSISVDALTTGIGLDISSTSTAGEEGESSKLLNLSRSGANVKGSHTAYGLYSSVINTGTTSTNIAGYFSAAGATNSYAAIFDAGNVGIGTTNPIAKLTVNGDILPMTAPTIIEISRTTTQIADADWTRYFASIAIGADGLPVIAYQNFTDGDLMILKCGNTACSSGNATTQITNTDDVGWQNSIAIGADGLPVISHINYTDKDLMITKCGNANCSSNTTTQIADADYISDNTSIAIGADGLPIIAYLNYTDDTLTITKCGNAACSAGNTTTQIPAYINEFVSIAIGNDGLPVVAHFDDFDDDLMITKCGTADCSSNATTQIADADDIGMYTSIAIGTDGLPVIAYLNYDNDALMITKCGNTACSSGNTTTQLGDSDGITSIAIGTDGLPIIAYLSNLDLTITKCADSTCSAATGTALTGGSQLGGWMANPRSYSVPFQTINTIQIANPTTFQNFSILTAGAERLTITPTGNVYVALTGGNVGIGTTTPTRKLDILDASNAQLRLTQAAGTVYNEFQSKATTGDLEVTTAGTGKNIVFLDNTLKVCESGACPAITGQTGTGDLIVENQAYFSGDKIIYPGDAGWTRPKRSIVLTAAGAIPPTAGGAAQTKVDGTNQTYYVLEYDADSDEVAYWQWAMPDSYDDGTIDITYYWVAASTANDVVWCFQAKGLTANNAEDIDSALSAAVCETDTAQGNTMDLASVTETGATSNFAKGEYVTFKVFRDADNGSDTMTGDARLLKVKIEYGVSQETD